MHFLFSGEGSTDCGACSDIDRICTGDRFQPGPMMLLASQIVEHLHAYSPLDSGCCGLVSRTALKAAIGDLKARRRSPSLPGPHRTKGTLYFRRSARALARLSRAWAGETNEEVVAILFRDNDDHQATSATLWRARRDATRAGFEEEGFARGVAMIPRPTSEAWLLCALKEQPYERCEALEERSGSPNAQRPLKKELADRLGATPTRELLCMLVMDGRVDAGRIEMPSFTAFREDLKTAIA